MVKIVLNGKEAEVAGDLTLAKLLLDMKIEPQMVACEMNRKIVKRGEYSKTAITEGDEIEILQMIGGG